MCLFFVFSFQGKIKYLNVFRDGFMKKDYRRQDNIQNRFENVTLKPISSVLHNLVVNNLIWLSEWVLICLLILQRLFQPICQLSDWFWTKGPYNLSLFRDVRKAQQYISQSLYGWYPTELARYKKGPFIEVTTYRSANLHMRAKKIIHR